MQAMQHQPPSEAASSERIGSLDSMRAIAIVMVVAAHTLGYCVQLQPARKEIVSFIVGTIPVPVFFLVDGYLFARSVLLKRTYSYLTYIRKSVVRLIIPWILFTLIYTLARYACEASHVFKEHLIIGHSLKDVLIGAYGSVYAPQMYFLVSLFLIRTCSPALKHLFVKKNYFLMLLLFGFYYFAYRLVMPFISMRLRIQGGSDPISNALWGMQFFICGIAVFRSSQIVDLSFLLLPSIFLFAISILFRPILPTFVVQYIYLLSFFIIFFSLKHNPSILQILGANSMGIYLLHCPIILRGVSSIADKFILNPLLSYIYILFMTLGLTSLAVYIITIIPYGRLLFGIPYRHRPTGSQRMQRRESLKSRADST